MASPTFVSEATAVDIAGATSKACSFTTPTAGDLILVGVYFKDGSGAVSTPSGYTKLEDLVGNAGSGVSAVFYKTSDGTETSVTCSIATSCTSISISVIVLGGGGAGNPVIATAADTELGSGAAGTYDTPAGAADTNDDAHVIFVGCFPANDSGSFATVSGYTVKARQHTGGSSYRISSGFMYKLDGNSTTIAATTGTDAGTTSYVNAHVFAVTIAPSSAPPECTVAPVVTGTPTWGQTLSCSEGTWTGDPTPTFTYQWQRSDHGADDYSPIASATSATYTLVAADIGKDIICTVTGSNTEGDVDANSNAVGAIAADTSTADGIEAAITSGEWTVTINPAITWRGGRPLHPATYNAERILLGLSIHLSARDGDHLVSVCNAYDESL